MTIRGNHLSVAEFCAREGISDSSFHRWRSRLQAGGSSKPDRATPGAFLDAGVLRREHPSAARLELTLDLGQGLQLSLVLG